MGNEGERHFGIRPVWDFVKRKAGRANPAGASVEGLDLSDEAKDALYLRTRTYTKAGSDATGEIPTSQKIPFGNVEEHRRRRGLR